MRPKGKKNQRLLWDSGQGSWQETLSDDETLAGRRKSRGAGWGRQDWRQRMSYYYHVEFVSPGGDVR